jgi:hypothetical protein
MLAGVRVCLCVFICENQWWRWGRGTRSGAAFVSYRTHNLQPNLARVWQSWKLWDWTLSRDRKYACEKSRAYTLGAPYTGRRDAWWRFDVFQCDFYVKLIYFFDNSSYIICIVSSICIVLMSPVRSKYDIYVCVRACVCMCVCNYVYTEHKTLKNTIIFIGYHSKGSF